MPDPEEIKLLKRCQQGSEEAFKELVEKYQKTTYWIAYNFLNDYELAQDISQEAFIRVFRSLRHFDPKRSFYTWLYQIVVNLCIDTLRKQAHQREIGGIEGYQDVVDVERDPRTMVERNELGRRVRDTLDRLPVKYKTVLLLRDIQGFSLEEVAQIIGCESATARWRLHRARRLFKYMWNKRRIKRETTRKEGFL
jgi:RNA polymerase sigma-70 factor (ECF subfamily)